MSTIVTTTLYIKKEKRRHSCSVRHSRERIHGGECLRNSYGVDVYFEMAHNTNRNTYIQNSIIPPRGPTQRTTVAIKLSYNKVRLFVKNKLQTQFLSVNLPDLPASDVHPTTISESRKKTDSGSIFKGYPAKVFSMDEVAAVKQFLIVNKPDVTKATHVIYAYVIRVFP